MAEILGQQMQQVPNYAGVNIQIFNPAVTTMPQKAEPNTASSNSEENKQAFTSVPMYPANYYTHNYAQTNGGGPVSMQIPNEQKQNVKHAAINSTAPEGTKKKTETREIVELTDDYIKNVENYLNSQDHNVRLIGAREVTTRFTEDKSRKDDLALNALVNKMLKDPYQPVRVIAMNLIETKAASGNEESAMILKILQQIKTKDGQDELQAANALLKMASQTTKKEFEIDESKIKKEQPKETKKG